MPLQKIKKTQSLLIFIGGIKREYQLKMGEQIVWWFLLKLMYLIFKTCALGESNIKHWINRRCIVGWNMPLDSWMLTWKILRLVELLPKKSYILWKKSVGTFNYWISLLRSKCWNIYFSNWVLEKFCLINYSLILLNKFNTI